jgi:hypothetical protein
MSELAVIDLDAERQRRAAEREGKREPLPIRLGGEVIALLPVELPIDVIAPLRDLDESITLLLRSAMKMQRAENPADRLDATELIIDLLAATPSLPLDVLDVIKRSAIALLSHEGYERLMAQALTTPDLAFLAKSVFAFYGVTLGESSPSSDSSTGDGGETSNTTSKPTSADSTPEASGPTPAIPGSSESAAS